MGCRFGFLGLWVLGLGGLQIEGLGVGGRVGIVWGLGCVGLDSGTSWMQASSSELD